MWCDGMNFVLNQKTALLLYTNSHRKSAKNVALTCILKFPWLRPWPMKKQKNKQEATLASENKENSKLKGTIVLNKKWSV